MKSISFLLVLLMILSSCTKDANKVPGDILTDGEYKVIEIKEIIINTLSYTVENVDYKSRSYSEYISKNNTGVFLIDSKNLTANGWSYSIDTLTRIDYYQNNKLVAFNVSPFVLDLSENNFSTEYKAISQDSVYINDGSIFSGITLRSSEPINVKFKADNDNLVFHSNKTQVKKTWQSNTLIIENIQSAFEITLRRL
ncbi:MAG: hypothetical protein QM768_09450 [Agriterribacter sp.]